MGVVGWVRTNRAHPCPVCGRSHYCSVSPAGDLVYCTKESSERLGSDGKGWIHRIGGERVNGHAKRNGHAAVLARTTYGIRDLDGVLVANHRRHDLEGGDKRVWWELPNGTKGLAGRKPETLPLYRSEALMTAGRGVAVFVCEGEKATDALVGLGLVAVGTVTGADGRPSEEVLKDLLGFDVCLWPDNDEVGRRHMRRIADVLANLHADPRILTWPDAPEKGDAADFVAAGLGIDELRALYRDAVVVTNADPVLEPGPEPDSEQTPTVDLHLTDMGNAERLVRRHGPDVRYCVAWKRWVVWGGEVWDADGDGLIQERAKETVMAIYEEGIAAEDAERATAVWKHAQRSESSGKVHAMVDLARSTPRLVVAPDDLDRDPWRLNCVNGTVDLRTGLLLPFAREDLMSKRSPAVYDATAACPVWLAFLDQVMGRDQEMVAYLGRLAGYCLTGMTVERVLFILFGGGRNGKSTFLEVLRHVMGDYASGTPASTIMSQRNKGIPNDIARLKGARFVSASETSEAAEIDEAFVKVATGGDTITARFLNAEFFDFRPQFKILLATNHKPSIKGTDPAVWDRIHLIPWLVRISDDQLDKELRDKLIAEADGVLQWMIHGCLAWQRMGGLFPPRAVVDATEEYRLDEDTLKVYLEDCCDEQPSVSATTKAMYESYKDWATSHGEDVMSQTRFGTRLRERGFRQIRVNRVRTWKGVRPLGGQGPNGQPDGLS